MKKCKKFKYLHVLYFLIDVGLVGALVDLFWILCNLVESKT